MKTECLIVTYNDVNYEVFITYGNFRNINYRLKKDGFHISAPAFVSKQKIINGLDKFAPKLIKHYSKNQSHFSFEEDYVYLLGDKVSLEHLNIKNIDELERFLKHVALEVFENLTVKYERIMRIEKPYKVHVRKMATRLGSNSLKTHSISYNIDLIHYSEDIISTVVVHELAHEFHRNHQQKFYDCVYFYCPDYKSLQRKLKKGIHS